MCAAFPAGTGDAHHLVNESEREVVFLGIGDRTPGDAIACPDDGPQGRRIDGQWWFAPNYGRSY